jgi:hypothetical protein
MTQPKRSPERFNPFEDRLSRDIRNDLSESVIDVIKRGSLEPARQVAASHASDDLAPIYREYIQNRLMQYEAVLTKLSSTEGNILKLAGVLWDLGLYFEVHEVLEPAWMKSSGDTRLLLQAIIRAAGVYIYRELGYEARAAKIAAKTIPVLKRFQARLQQDVLTDDLIVALEEPTCRKVFLTKPG